MEAWAKFAVFAVATALMLGCGEEQGQSVVEYRNPGLAGKQPIASAGTGDKSNLVVDGSPVIGAARGPGPSSFSGDNANPIHIERWNEPDVRAQGTYDAKGIGKMEIEAACRFSDGVIECWDMRGQRLPALGSRIQAALKDQTGSMNDIPTADIAIGSKNRLIVARITKAPSAPFERITLDFAGRYRQSFGLRILSPENAKTPSRYRLAVASEEPGIKTTRARFSIWEEISGSARIDLKVGATTELSGTTFKVVLITSSHERVANARGTWLIRLERSRTDQMLQLQAVPGSSTFTFSSGMMRRGDKHVTFATTSNPEDVRSITFTGTRIRTVELTGIPMDPKR